MSAAGTTAADALVIARAAGERLRVEAADRDRERRFPHAEIAELKRTPLMGLVVPQEWGGLGADDRTLCAVLGALAEGDPNVAQMYLIHSYGVMTINAMLYPEAAKERPDPVEMGVDHPARAIRGGRIVRHGVVFEGGDVHGFVMSWPRERRSIPPRHKKIARSPNARSRPPPGSRRGGSVAA